MPTQMTHQEQQSIDVALRSGGTAVDVIAKINNERMAKGVQPVASSTVYRFIRGATHARGAPERRGGRGVCGAYPPFAGLDWLLKIYGPRGADVYRTR